MLPGKGYSLTVPAPDRLPRLPSILTEARVAVTPLGTSLRVGGTLELGRGEGPPDPRRVAGIVRSFTTHYPDFAPADFAAVTPWSGLRPCSPDGLPYIGRFARYDNLVAATGHAMMGVSLGPITGRLVAEIVSGEPPSVEISALHPDRFS
jgi:D-amino-acid dehydrogenase